MRYLDAVISSFSLDDAKAELRRHGITVTVADDGTIIDNETGERIATPIEPDVYEGADIIGYLGY
ncbi:hypothetical protein G8E10_24835 [Rhizobiaceae bacterium CRRU44]|uniref:Uncharacterized protein n=1 Tax=Ferranicluibacter rubi TaxID=2715133 RepID=A0AA43ZJQ3_9HYPH|nr:hypothetical protein [Ferranicluibacter rubi]NHT78929.1 hypothetical protein [Ferranicluibacter rubi]